MKQVPLFHCTQPCSNCPYRIDAPVKHWDKTEFASLLEDEQDLIGHTYDCHKRNGSICVGWLMKQDEANLPCIAVRILLSMKNVTGEYLDSLNSPTPLYENTRAMVRANFPQLLKTKKITL